MVSIPPFPPATLPQLPWFVLLGVICGVVGAVFLKNVARESRAIPPAEVADLSAADAAGLVVGVIAIVFPGVCGNGYSVTNDILH